MLILAIPLRTYTRSEWVEFISNLLRFLHDPLLLNKWMIRDLEEEDSSSYLEYHLD